MNITSTSSLEETLNAYIADEYFASLQYRMAKVVAKGKALEHSNNVFGDNGDEEDEHFDEIVEYAQSLNIPVQVNPKEMETNCTTPFVELHDGDTTAQLVTILISAEKKAIEGYETGLRNEEIIKEHPELTQFFGELLNDERGHLKELEDLESSIAASGKVVPQSDLEKDGDEDVKDDADNAESEDSEDETEGKDYNLSEKNESVDGPEISAENDIMRKISLGELKTEDVVKNLLGFITEEKASDFADYDGFFSSDLARDTSQYDDNQCKNKFIEMIDDGMLDSKDVLEKLMKFIGKDELESFSDALGYSSATDESEERTIVHKMQMSESGMSFSEIFHSTING